MNRLILAFLLFLLSCAQVATAAGAQADPPRERGLSVEDSLQTLQKLTASVSTLRCRFVQTTNIPLFTEPVISRGFLLFARPDSLLWEYSEPFAQGFALQGTKGFRWEGSRDSRVSLAATEDPVAGLVAAQALSWISFDRKWIEAHYAVRAEGQTPLLLVLTPKNAEMASVVSSISLSFARDGIAREILLREAGGGTTTILLHDVVLNQPVGSEEFQ
ncbi:MAG: outer membrane lipoprotein carrier protein LolA [Desulfovibrio sp.]|jgi:outer membrane lipoprotein-sorting protein|nr:outer membrane lipoprotein carrier protein LolA [Desulfovibrio sp.]